MNTQIVVVALCLFAGVNAGSITWERCPMVGTIRDVRISGCSLTECNLTPATAANGEVDLIPSSAVPSLRLRVIVHYFADIEIINAEIPGSSVQPGQEYTIVYQIVPSDQLSGNTFEITSEISHNGGTIVEGCAKTEIRIL